MLAELSAGAIAGIAVGAALVLLVIIWWATAFAAVRRRKRRQQLQRQQRKELALAQTAGAVGPPLQRSSFMPPSAFENSQTSYAASVSGDRRAVSGSHGAPQDSTMHSSASSFDRRPSLLATFACPCIELRRSVAEEYSGQVRR